MVSTVKTTDLVSGNDIDKSLVQNKNRVGPSTYPWKPPQIAGWKSDVTPLWLTADQVWFNFDFLLKVILFILNN